MPLKETFLVVIKTLLGFVQNIERSSLLRCQEILYIKVPMCYLLIL